MAGHSEAPTQPCGSQVPVGKQGARALPLGHVDTWIRIRTLLLRRLISTHLCFFICKVKLTMGSSV